MRTGKKNRASRIVIFTGCIIIALMASLTGQERGARHTVLLVELGGNDADAIWVDEAAAAYLERASLFSRKIAADYVIIHLCADRGKADASVWAAESILTNSVPTAVLVTNRATDGGILIALAADRIFVKNTALLGGTGDMKLPASFNKAWADEMSRVALTRKRSALLARAMADPSIVITEAKVNEKVVFLDAPGLAAEGEKHAAGKINSFETGAVVCPRGVRMKMSGTDAVGRFKMADGFAASVEDVLSNLKRDGARIVRFPRSGWEQLARFVIHPVVRSILAVIGLLGLFIEIKIPGVIGPGALSSICFRSVGNIPFLLGHFASADRAFPYPGLRLRRRCRNSHHTHEFAVFIHALGHPAPSVGRREAAKRLTGGGPDIYRYNVACGIFRNFFEQVAAQNSISEAAYSNRGHRHNRGENSGLNGELGILRKLHDEFPGPGPDRPSPHRQGDYRWKTLRRRH